MLSLLLWSPDLISITQYDIVKSTCIYLYIMWFKSTAKTGALPLEQMLRGLVMWQDRHTCRGQRKPLLCGCVAEKASIQSVW